MKRLKKFFLTKNVLIVLGLSLVLLGTTAYIEAKKVSQKGYLGVSIKKISSEEKEEFGVSHGVIVTKVVEGKAADKAGIKEDDIIQFFDGEKIRTTSNLIGAVRETKPGTRVTIKLIRKGKKKDITVVMGKLKSRHLWFDKDKNVMLISGGRVYLGIHLQELNEDLAEYFGVKEDEGVLVVKVKKDSPAEKAGLKSGDVITKIDNKNVSSSKDIHKILSDFEDGDKVDIAVVRHKRSKVLKAVLKERKLHRGIEIFKFDGDKMFLEPGHFHFSIPEIEIPEIVFPEFELPRFEEFRIKWKEKYWNKLEKKLKKLEERLHHIKESFSI